jgi:hypothetical protein
MLFSCMLDSQTFNIGAGTLRAKTTSTKRRESVLNGLLGNKPELDRHSPPTSFSTTPTAPTSSSLWIIESAQENLYVLFS